MSITVPNYDDKLHKIRVKLHPNSLPKVDGKYFARTIYEDSLNLEDVCNMMKTRGRFDGDYASLVDNLKCYFREVAYQVCDGFAVNTGYFTIYPNIGGTFDSAKEPFDPEKHKITFRYRTNPELRKLIKEIAVEVTGVSDANAFIYRFTDNDENSVNSTFSPNNLFTILGKKIKIEGDDPSCGVFFVPVDDPSKAVKVKRIAVNNPNEIVGIAPDTEHMLNRIEIRTKFTGSKTIVLKEARVIKTDFVLEAI